MFLVIQTTIDFLIVAVAIFAMVIIINTAKARFEKQEAAAPPAAPSEDVVLLREIRDALKSRKFLQYVICKCITPFVVCPVANFAPIKGQQNDG
ncbi:MAG: MscL family protein, partial [Planctomycetota bacterium]|nr:MscL family protein [Planctomycetota bacterium]